ncbi:retrograde regulation protein 2 [Ilyonectria sp. MPI-CAGE-AT-0026]|nr:retrograde regulation protein 2 [Ilyonectria sp. MPI-CAGE-AT-0026]
MFARLHEYFRGNPRSPLEKKLVFKLDVFILTFCCLAYFMNYLDRSNITQAYVSGMKEDLKFKGAELTVINSIYQTGYMIGIVPNNLLLTRFRPRIFFPLMIVIWAAFTMCTAAAKRPEDIMVIRFFQGYAESCVFAGTHFILGSWYTEEELGKRSAIFTGSGLAGGMFGGLLQSGIHKSMNGLHGLPGWRWLFIIDGIITLPVAIYGYVLFPDTPATTTAPYLSAEEKQLAIARVPISEDPPVLNKEFAKTVFNSWYFYAFALLWILGNCSEAFSSQSLLNLYMQAHPTITYTVYQLNNYPTGVQAVGIVSTLLWASYTDIYGKRWITGYYNAIVGIATSIIILVPSTTTAGHFGAYYWAGSIYCCQATFFAWANDTLRSKPPAMRAVVIGTMNFSGNLFQAWWPLIFYRADAAPKFTRGMICMIVICSLLAIWVTVMVRYERRDKKEQAVLEGLAIADAADAKVADVEVTDIDKKV